MCWARRAQNGTGDPSLTSIFLVIAALCPGIQMLAPFVGVLYKFLYKSLWGETYPLHNPWCGNPLSDPMRRVTPCSLMLLGFVRPKEALLGGVPESCLKLTCTPVGPQEICVCVTCQIGECQFSTTGLSPPFSSPCQEGTKSRTANSLYNQTSV